MLKATAHRPGPATDALRRHFRSHAGPLTAAVLLACAGAMVWWGDTVVMLPHLPGGPAIPVEAANCLPVLIAAVVLLSTSDALGDFSEHAARPRRRIISLHLAGTLTVSAALICLALLSSGAAGQTPVALRNLFAGAGLAALGAALLGTRISWVAPLALATPALTIGNPDTTAWWQWPTAPADTHSWALTLLTWVLGTTALLCRTAPYRQWRAARGH